MNHQSLSQLITEIKQLLHGMNHDLESRKIQTNNFVFATYEIWRHIHEYRTQFNITPADQIYKNLNMVAGYCSKIQTELDANYFNVKKAVSLFMQLRKVTKRLEIDAAKTLYKMETQKNSSKMLTISEVVIGTNKNDKTIRRHIFSGKLKAYKLAKEWFIPYEEVIRVYGGYIHKGVNESK
ncbi:helix-turn-helix domain-containing protein [Paenibacillus rubinfantis]|uniref:helix-turn-helix domain-containing protein n=1 Tax=Paenibacillus rubinfantis TaxID=1720296 RepID=UPI00073ECBC5|nr:helix-turn-helix domain-containing protein [Paenibacillus rubinfantis]